MIDEKKLNLKLGQWRWPEAVSVQITGSTVEIAFSSGTFELIDWFTESLDACFKWLVPKLQLEDNWLYDIEFTYNHPNGSITCDIKREVDLIQAHAETPALALCLAIEKLIDQEVKCQVN